MDGLALGDYETLGLDLVSATYLLPKNLSPEY